MQDWSFGCCPWNIWAAVLVVILAIAIIIKNIRHTRWKRRLRTKAAQEEKARSEAAEREEVLANVAKIRAAVKDAATRDKADIT